MTALPARDFALQFALSTASCLRCSVTFSGQTGRCQLISDAAVVALTGAAPPTNVATFGNVDVSDVGDWVTILSNDISPTVSRPLIGQFGSNAENASRLSHLGRKRVEFNWFTCILTILPFYPKKKQQQIWFHQSFVYDFFYGLSPRAAQRQKAVLR